MWRVANGTFRIRIPANEAFFFDSNAGSNWGSLIYTPATPTTLRNILYFDGSNSTAHRIIWDSSSFMELGGDAITSDYIRITNGDYGANTPNIISATFEDLRLQAATDGQFVDIGPQWKSSDTVTYSSPFEYVQMNGTVNNITGTWSSAIMRSAPTQNVSSGGTGFGSQIYGLSFTNQVDGSSSTTSNANFGNISSIAGVAYWNGGLNTVFNVIGGNFQCGTNNTGTVTNSYAVNGQCLTVVGGAITNGASGRFLMPSTFIGGGITTGYGVWINGAGSSFTRWGIYQDNATPNNALYGSTSIGHINAPFNVSTNLDIASQMRMRSVSGLNIFHFGDSAGATKSRILTNDSLPGAITFDSSGNTNNSSFRIDMESTADVVLLESGTGANLHIDFPKIYFGAVAPNNSTSNRFMRIAPAQRSPDIGLTASYYDVEYSPSAALALGSEAHTDISAVRITAMSVSHDAATVNGNYSNFHIAGAPTGGPTPGGERLALWVQADKSLLDGPLHTTDGRLVGVTRQTGTPYTALDTDHHIFMNTDGQASTVNLPAGVAGTEYRIVNTGTSSNSLTVTPNGSENLLGANSSFTLNDGESLIIVYDSNDGWF
jgi:hypothetical protein